MVLLKISLVIFMAGNLLDMGLKLDPRDALRGLRDVRFVAYTIVWGFVLCPALAYAITRVLPLAEPYAVGLILLGMTPCAPFLPMLVNRAKGDLGYTAAFMVLASVGTVIFMPIAVPLMVKGLTVSAWAIAMPLLVVILIPLAIGMVLLRISPALAAKVQPIVKKVTGVATILTVVLCIVVYGKGLLGLPGELAIAAQLLFFAIVSAGTYLCAFGLRPDRKIVLCTGMTTRQLGAALAPLLAAPGMDQRATVMLVLGLPMMVIFALLATTVFGRSAPAPNTETQASL
jgi:bile acid:Na+ symporter, BASS family